MTRCPHISQVLTGVVDMDGDKVPVHDRIQCMNEKGHVGGHLILDENDEFK